jgi:hypothetical protein
MRYAALTHPTRSAIALGNTLKKHLIQKFSAITSRGRGLYGKFQYNKLLGGKILSSQ